MSQIWSPEGWWRRPTHAWRLCSCCPRRQEGGTEGWGPRDSLRSLKTVNSKYPVNRNTEERRGASKIPIPMSAQTHLTMPALAVWTDAGTSFCYCQYKVMIISTISIIKDKMSNYVCVCFSVPWKKDILGTPSFASLCRLELVVCWCWWMLVCESRQMEIELPPATKNTNERREIWKKAHLDFHPTLAFSCCFVRPRPRRESCGC